MKPCSNRIAAALTMVCVVAAPAISAELSTGMQEIVAAAKKEGKLNLLWGQGSLGGSEGAKRLAAGLNKMFGTNIDVRYTPGPPVTRVANQIITDFKAGRSARTDVFQGANAFASRLEEEGVSEKIAWPKLLPGRVTDAFMEAGGTAVRIHTSLPGGIVYNTNLAPYKPTKLADLLKPEWKGKIASTPYASGFDVMAFSDFWGGKSTIDFARKFSKQITGLIRCSELERIASGEFIAYAMDCTGRSWVELAKKGAPIAFVVPEDFSIQRFYYLTVPKNAVNPAAAKLLIAYLLSQEGQKILWETDNVDLHMFPNSGMAKVVADYEKQGVKFSEVTVARYRSNKGASKVQREVKKILAKR